MRTEVIISILLVVLLLSSGKGKELKLKEIFPTKPKFSEEKLKNILSIVNNLTPENVSNSVQLNRKKAEIEIFPVWYVNFLPFGEYYIEWDKENNEEKLVVIKNGNITIRKLFSILNKKGLAYKQGENFIFKTPIYISPGASLSVEEVNWGLGAPVLVSGLLFIKDSQVFAWNLQKNQVSVMPKLTYRDYYLVGTVKPRPYIKTLGGGKLIILNSKVEHLGFRGLSSSFGISIVGWPFRKKFVEDPVLYLLYSDKWHHHFGLNRLRSEFKKGKTLGIMVGSDFTENFMGFFSNDADDVFLVGNLYRENYQYNIDPHDWTKNIIVAYNWIEATHKAHGAIFSRFVNGAVIENVSINNHGAGIMMDRCSKSYIYKNLLINNRLGGISLLESDDNVLIDNTVLRNHDYGIFVRNSLGTYLKGNQVVHNLGFGEEVAIADLSRFTYRNFIIDKYHMAASSWNESNSFIENLNGEIKSIKGAFGFYRNRFKFLYLTPFLGDLAPYTLEILENQSKEPVIIPGKGNPEWIGINLPDVRKSILKLEKHFWKMGNAAAITDYSLYLLWDQFENTNKFLKGKQVPSSFKEGFKLLVKRASEGDRKALTFLGVILLSYAPNSYDSEALTYIAEGALIGSSKAQYVLTILPLISNVKREEIESSIQRAIKKIESGRLVNCKLLKLPTSVCSYPENLHLLRERMRNVIREKFIKEYNSFLEFFRNKVSPLQKKALKEKIQSIKLLMKENNAKFLFYFSHSEERKRNNKFPDDPLFFKKESKRKAVEEFQKLFLEKHRDSDIKLIKPRVKEFTKKFNRYRKIKLTPDEALKLIEEKCFDVRFR